jgi:hypothetical protein
MLVVEEVQCTRITESYGTKIHRVGEMQRFLVLKQAVLIVTTLLLRLDLFTLPNYVIGGNFRDLFCDAVARISSVD